MTGARRHSHDRSTSAAPSPQPPPPSSSQRLPTTSPIYRHRRDNNSSRRHVSVSTGGGLSVSAAPGSTPHASEHINEEPGSDDHSSGAIDAKKWFDSSNKHPMLPSGSVIMEATSSLYQKGSDDSAEDFPTGSPAGPFAMAPPLSNASFLPPSITHTREQTDLTDDYRSVIDDLTIENKRLKEELKRYRDNANRDVLEKEKLFEIKMHGLPRRKKQELENTLRNFAASLDNSTSSGSTSRHMREKSASSKNKSNVAVHSSGGPSSKHASTSSSRSRPVDSAYASMSTGAASGGPATLRPSFGGPLARTSEQKVERYLQDIPEGLHPNYGFGVLSDRDKKKLIVRRLEQLFTGKIGGRYFRRNRAMPPPTTASTTDTSSATTDEKFVGAGVGIGASIGKGTGISPGVGASIGVSPGVNTGCDIDAGASAGVFTPAPASVAIATASGTSVHSAQSSEPIREAQIQTPQLGQKSRGSRDNMSLSNSNSIWDEAGNGNGNGHGRSGSRSNAGNGNGNGNGNGSGSGSGYSKSPSDVALPEQRPTRPRDLDPDRVQVPAENMEYIRHLGLAPPVIEPVTGQSIMDVSPDADGWVYLNLLANLAQLHIFNVAPDFIRKAIVEKSTKFQLSPDGQKIRWRGGTEGTKFSSDGSSGDNSQQELSTDDGDGSDENGKRKRKKMSGDGSGSARSSSKGTRSGTRRSRTQSLFHYKPLFFRQNLPPASTGGIESESSDEMEGSNCAVTASNIQGKDNSSSEQSPSGTSSHRKRRRVEGVLVYYTGAPFCTDLAGESSGGASPTTYETSTGQAQDSADSTAEASVDRPSLYRSPSGGHTKFRPLTDYDKLSREELVRLGLASATGLTSSDDDSSLQSGDMGSPMSVNVLLADDLVWYEDTDHTSASGEPEEPALEASGIGRVFPEDHFSVLVTTKRPLRCSESSCDVSMNGEDDEDDKDEKDGSIHTKGVFSMASLMKRLAALKRQSAPISGAVPRQNQENTPGTGIVYVSTEMKRRDPVPLPPPAMFYPPLSTESESSSDEDSLGPVDEDDEDESMLSSSSEEMISRRANPQSDKNPSAASQAMAMSGESMDVDSKEDM